MIECRICRREFKFISPKHLKCIHGIGVAEYRSQFGEIMSEEQKTSWAQKQKENHWSRKPIEETVELRAKLAENGKKVMALIKEDGRAYRFTSETSKAIWTEEHRKKIREKLTGMQRTEEIKEKMRRSHWSKKTKKEVEAILQRIFSKDAQFKNTARGWYSSEKSGHEMFYMSSYERRRLEFLENNQDVSWFSTAHLIQIPYKFQGTQHLYIPDIHVRWSNGTETLEEIKGYVREPEKHKAKLEAGKRYCQQHGIVYSLIFEEGLEEL